MNLMFLLLMLSLNSWANCPNLAGTYGWENPDPRDSQAILLTITQNGCDQLTAEYNYGRGTVYLRNFQIDGQRHLIFDLENAKLFETHLWQNGKIYIKSELEILQEDNSWATDVVHAYVFLDTPNLLVEESYTYDGNGKVDGKSKSHYLRK